MYIFYNLSQIFLAQGKLHPQGGCRGIQTKVSNQEGPLQGETFFRHMDGQILSKYE